jgi:hypothetical protein
MGTLAASYIACVDEPASYYWKQLWKAFPDALVILSIRDSATWWESIQTITQQIKEEKSQPDRLTQTRREFLEFLYTMYPELDEESTREKDIKFFDEHNRKVLAFAEENEKFKQRLLVWRSRDG